MSAYVVGHDHIDALLTFAIERKVSYFVADTGATVEINLINASAIGAILLQENERSVRHRYSSTPADDLPGTDGERADNYVFRRFAELPSPQNLRCTWVLKGCDCFDYQACETDDYERTLACRIIDCIRLAAVDGLPNYDGAPWEIVRKRPIARDGRAA
jgi:hypothetical protein